MLILTEITVVKLNYERIHSERTLPLFHSLPRQVLMLAMGGAISTSQALGQMILLKLKPPRMWAILVVGSFVLMTLRCKWVAAMTQVHHQQIRKHYGQDISLLRLFSQNTKNPHAILIISVLFTSLIVHKSASSCC